MKPVINAILNKIGISNACFQIKDGRIRLLDPDASLSILKHHSMGTAALYSCDIENQGFMDELSQATFEETVFQVRLSKVLSETISILTEGGIETILLKGFAMSRYYPEDLVRPTSDLDILIRPEHRDDALEILQNNGYCISNPEAFDCLLKYHGEVDLIAPDGKTSVEIHWDFISSGSIRKTTVFDADMVFSTAVPFSRDGLELQVLAPKIDLPFLMAHHVLHHQFKRPLWLLDICLILTSGKVDPGDIIDYTRLMKLERPVFYYLEALELLLPEFFGTGILDIKKALLPGSVRYHVFSKFTPPSRIFFKGGGITRFRDQLFRNAFK